MSDDEWEAAKKKEIKQLLNWLVQDRGRVENNGYEQLS